MPAFSLTCAAIAAAIAMLFSTMSNATVAAEDRGFALKDSPGNHLDVLLDGRVVARYMYAHDTSTKERRTDTSKPYLHVFDAEGKAPITKGPGGLFPHHRGIFIGWKKINYAGKDYNLWEMASGDIVHKEFANQKADATDASFTSKTEWDLSQAKDANAGKKILEEERTMTFRRAPAPFRLIIDFTSTVKAVNGDLVLSGDPEHGGVQFRPANELSTAETTYVFPKESADPHHDADYPWVGETFTLHGQQHSVVEISHPDDPKGTRWSAYRDYGRFGAFPEAKLKSGDSITLRYRFLIADGPMPPADAIQKAADAYTGASTPTPTPKVTVRPAERTPAPATKPAAKPAAAKGAS
jgi:hypothetical protein